MIVLILIHFSYGDGKYIDNVLSGTSLETFPLLLLRNTDISWCNVEVDSRSMSVLNKHFVTINTN